jgi:exonuclease SbcC
MIRPNQKPSNEEIIGYGSGEAQVRLEFAIGDKKYRVVRDVHKTRANRAILYELSSDGKPKTIATTVNDTTSEVERLLAGITYNEIVASSVVAQKDLERLIKQRLDDRRKVINVFLNLDSFNRVQEELDNERIRVEGTARTPGQVTVEKQQLEALTEKLKEYREKEAQSSSLDEKVRKLTVDLADFEKQFQETDSLHRTLKEYEDALIVQESLRREIHDKTVLKDNLVQQLASVSSKRDELEEARARLKGFEDLGQVEPQLAHVSKLLDDLRGREVRHGQLLEQEKQLAEKMEKGKDLSVPSDLPAGNASSKRVWSYLAATGALGAGAILSFFLSLIPAAITLGSLAVVFLILLARQIASLSQEAEVSTRRQEQLAGVQLIQMRRKDLDDIRLNLNGLRETISTSGQEILHLLNGLPRYSSSLKGQNDPKAALELVTSLYNQDKQSQYTLEERVKLLEKQLEEEPEIRKTFQATEEEIQQVTDKLGKIPLPILPEGMHYSGEALTSASEQRDSLNERVSRVRTQIEDAVDRQVEFKRFLEENKNVEEKVETQGRKVRLLEKDLAVLKYSIKGLEQTSESLRNRVKPQVERYMGLILPIITSGHYKAVELDDDYTVRVFDPEAGEFKPKEVFSGGTEDQLLLAMRLAFALTLIPQAKGQSPEFLFLDEPLGSSDRVRREGILALLRKELAQNFRQIFLISHIGDLEAEADTIIQMENGTVREVVGRKPSLPEAVEVPA